MSAKKGTHTLLHNQLTTMSAEKGTHTLLHNQLTNTCLMIQPKTGAMTPSTLLLYPKVVTPGLGLVIGLWLVIGLGLVIGLWLVIGLRVSYRVRG